MNPAVVTEGNGGNTGSPLEPGPDGTLCPVPVVSLAFFRGVVIGMLLEGAMVVLGVAIWNWMT